MKSLMNKNATINMECNNEESFKWAMTRALDPIGKDSQRITKILREQAEKYNWEGLDFPTPLEQIEIFEKNNNLLVNVFGFNKEKGCVETLRIPDGDRTGRILLMLIDGRYTIVKSISRLLSGQATRRNCRRFYCDNCLKGFSSEGKLDKHVTCSDEKSPAEQIKQRPRSKPKCELCSKQRTATVCALHSDLKRCNALRLIYNRKVREEVFRSDRVSDVFANYNGEAYKAVLKEGEWVFDSVDSVELPDRSEARHISEMSILTELLKSM